MINLLELNALKLFLMFLVAYSGGLLVTKKNIRVNYTRKINHFFLFFVPALADHYFLWDRVSLTTLILNHGFFVFATFIVFIKPMRRNYLIATAFSSFDRPEDRPYTLLWYVSQSAVGYLVMVPIIYVFDQCKMLDLIDIPILIGTFGDGLAEPIGVRFGRHKYTAYSIFSDRKFVRSLEGSAVVLIVSIIVVCMNKSFFSDIQFLAALVSIPVIMTMSEAFSPHTWDEPFMIAAGSLSVFSISTLL